MFPEGYAHFMTLCRLGNTHTHIFSHVLDPGAHRVVLCNTSFYFAGFHLCLCCMSMYCSSLFQVSYIHGLAVFENYLYATHSDPSIGNTMDIFKIHRFNTTEPRTLTSLGSSRGAIRVYHRLTQPKGKGHVCQGTKCACLLVSNVQCLWGTSSEISASNLLVSNASVAYMWQMFCESESFLLHLMYGQMIVLQLYLWVANGLPYSSHPLVRSHACETDLYGKPGGCSHICLLSGSYKSRTCRCRTGFSLESDGQSCKSQCHISPSFPYVINM